MQSHDAVRSSCAEAEVQWDCAVAGGDLRDPFGDQDGDDVDDELVDSAGVEEGRDGAGGAHHPGALA